MIEVTLLTDQGDFVIHLPPSDAADVAINVTEAELALVQTFRFANRTTDVLPKCANHLTGNK